jgi:hypothetical protein
MKKLATATTTATSQKKLPKKIIALKYLMLRSMIQPEAHELYGETCLHTTISTLWNEHGIAFKRVAETYGKFDARFTRYTLIEESRERAIQLISSYTSSDQAA